MKPQLTAKQREAGMISSDSALFKDIKGPKELQ